MNKDYRITFPVPEKIYHDKDNINDCFGVCQEELTPFLERFMGYCKKSSTPSEIVESLLKDGVSEKELYFIFSTYCYTQIERIHSSQILAGFCDLTGKSPEEVIKELNSHKNSEGDHE